MCVCKLSRNVQVGLKLGLGRALLHVARASFSVCAQRIASAEDEHRPQISRGLPIDNAHRPPNSGTTSAEEPTNSRLLRVRAWLASVASPGNGSYPLPSCAAARCASSSGPASCQASSPVHWENRTMDTPIDRTASSQSTHPDPAFSRRRLVQAGAGMAGALALGGVSQPSRREHKGTGSDNGFNA